MEDFSLHQHPWYFGDISRNDAESNLRERGENEGCFLVRESQSRKGNWTISVLDWTNGHCSVSHYLIKKNQNGWYYFEDDIAFQNIAQLVEYYKDNPDNVNFTLREPCPREFRIPDKLDDYDLYEVVTELPDGETFIKEQLIATGIFNEVWRGHLISNSRFHVVAKIEGKNPDSTHALTQEANILKCLNHENIVRFRGVLSVATPFHLIAECAGDQNLLEFLLTVDKTKVSLSERLHIAEQVTSALKYCERMRCIHRNVKAKSIIINSEDLRCRLGSFKHARTADDYGYYHAANEDERFGVRHDSRLRWMAPEAVRLGRFSSASDVWSFAVLLVEIFTNGALPFAGHLTCKVIEEVEKGYRNSKPASCPDAIYHLMHRCWDMSQVERPNFISIKETLEKYVKDNFEALSKLGPISSRNLSRYVAVQPSVKQSRTSTRKSVAVHQFPPSTPARKSNQSTNYSYDN